MQTATTQRRVSVPTKLLFSRREQRQRGLTERTFDVIACQVCKRAGGTLQRRASYYVHEDCAPRLNL